MNKKGFTLVELLGVLVVLSVILMIAFPLITTYINKSKQKAYDTQMEIIMTGLKNYANEHKEVLPVNDADYVTFTLGQLKSLGIANNSVVNPLDGKEIDDSMEFKIIKDGSKYTYQIVESSRLSRDDKNHTPYITLNGHILNYIDLDSTYTELGASATDYDGKPLSVTIDKTDLDVSTIGVYQIRYEAIDSNNTKSYAIRTVIVGEFKILANGTVVYYNPETNTKCTSAEAVSVSGTKTGCMKWYVFNDDGKSKTVNLLLDHNTTAAVPWITEEDYIESGGTKEEFEREIISKGPITALKQLKSDTSTWNKSINPRLIEANEIVTITEYPIWDNNFYYFHTNSQTQYKGAAGTNKYAWLFDNTRSCTQHGCNVADFSNSGYWTNTADSGYYNNAWFVDRSGILSRGSVEYAVSNGVRPVITVLKDVIK